MKEKEKNNIENTVIPPCSDIEYDKEWATEITNKSELKTFLEDLLFLPERDGLPTERTSDNPSFTILFDLLQNRLPITMCVEEEYVDRMYRDSYYLFFASKRISYSRFCKRLSLFKGRLLSRYKDDFSAIPEKRLQRSFMGNVVIRPLKNGKIGRSLLNPYYFTDVKNTYLRYAEYDLVLMDKNLTVNAFPFQMQDRETTTCAEITILNLMDYYSNRYQDYKMALPSDICALLDLHGFERTLPSKGITYSNISRIFSEMDFFPRLYGSNMFQQNSIFKLKHLIHYYIESGIPVAIGIKKSADLHSITFIGHGKIHKERIGNETRVVYNRDSKSHLWFVDTADLCDDYIVMDDGNLPYSTYHCTVSGNKVLIGDDVSNGEVINMVIPLHRRVFLDPEDAFQICVDAFGAENEGTTGIRRFIDEEIGTKDNPIVLRMFLATSRHFRKSRIESCLKSGSPAVEAYLNVILPKFVWVCEAYRREDYLEDSPKALAEVVVDATASKGDVNAVIMYNYSGIVGIPNQSNYAADSSDAVVTRQITQLCDYEYEGKEEQKLDAYCRNLPHPRR